MQNDPSSETLANRQAGMDLLREASIRGDALASMTFDMMRLAENYYINPAIDYADDDDGWDDIRPY